MANLHIENSYNIWSTKKMKKMIANTALNEYNSSDPKSLLSRTYIGMYVEWWLHNAGYYITKPFCFNNNVRKTNLRFKDVDLEEIL